MHKRLYPLSGMGCQRRHTSKSLESVTYALCPGGDTHSKRRASHWQVSFALCLKRVPRPDTNKVTGKSQFSLCLLCPQVRTSHWKVSFALCLKRVPRPDTNKVTGKSKFTLCLLCPQVRTSHWQVAPSLRWDGLPTTTDV